RDYVHSPDPEYVAKLQAAQEAVQHARKRPGEVVALFLDEVGCYRQPTLAPSYELAGESQALARRSYQSDDVFRLVATLDALGGQVVYRRANAIEWATLVAFYRQL